jgi:hypothetical protein
VSFIWHNRNLGTSRRSRRDRLANRLTKIIAAARKLATEKRQKLAG